MQDDNNQPQTGWTYRNEGYSSPEVDSQGEFVNDGFEPIAWTGSEYISQQKNPTWYLALFGGMAVLCAAVYLFSKDITSVVFIVIIAILFAIIAARKPRQLRYEITPDGLFIGKRHYFFDDFKSFALQRDGAIGYISLLPLKRFLPELAIYFAPEDERRIMEALSQAIPYEEHKENVFDKFARLIRF